MCCEKYVAEQDSEGTGVRGTRYGEKGGVRRGKRQLKGFIEMPCYPYESSSGDMSRVGGGEGVAGRRAGVDWRRGAEGGRAGEKPSGM
jgi:hypothetical protein